MTQIAEGQVYESCDPREDVRLRVVSYTPGAVRARVTDLDGKRPRDILARSLHATATTQTGAPRRTGYRLVEGTE